MKHHSNQEQFELTSPKTRNAVIADLDNIEVKHTKPKKKKKLGAVIAAVVICAALILAGAAFAFLYSGKGNLKRDVVIEAGSEIKIEDFFTTCPVDAKFLTDVSAIDTKTPAVYMLKVGYGEFFAENVTLRIEDHTAPTGVAIPQTQFTQAKWPVASDCVSELYDLSGIASVSFKDELPKNSGTGEFNVIVLVSDIYSNVAEINVPFNVIDDHTAPVITGIKPLESDGDPDGLDFYVGVSVTDDYDKDPLIRVDDSKVDYSKNGVYEIIYKAIDVSGNICYETTTVTVILPKNGAKKTNTGGGYSGTAKEIANKIFKDYGMKKSTDVATARAIFDYVHNNIWYQRIRGTQTYEGAAYRGFTRHSGDCYVYYSCMKMLLDIAGIPNMKIQRKASSGSLHMWNLVKLNGAWYHCDATRYGYHLQGWFMCTDKQINDKYHKYDGYQYPERAGGSTAFKPSDTPTPTPTATPTPDPNNPTSTPIPTAGPTPTTDPAKPTNTPANPTPTTAPNPDDPTPTPAQASPTPTPAEEKPTVTPTPVPATSTPKPTPKSTATPKPTPTQAPSGEE